MRQLPAVARSQSADAVPPQVKLHGAVLVVLLVDAQLENCPLTSYTTHRERICTKRIPASRLKTHHHAVPLRQLATEMPDKWQLRAFSSATDMQSRVPVHSTLCPNQQSMRAQLSNKRS